MFVEANPGPVKAAMAKRGLLAPEIRLPLVWPKSASMDKTFGALDRAGLA
jgi:dihydrodipicolinate synthase/N-acetylneuraminate lyase